MWQKIASPPCNIPTHNWTGRVFISPKAAPTGAKVLFWEGRTRDSSAQRGLFGALVTNSVVGILCDGVQPAGREVGVGVGYRQPSAPIC